MGEPPLHHPFSGATGLVGPLRVRLEGPGLQGPSTFEFDQPFLVVGRVRSADLVIDHPEVSRLHAYFQIVDGRVFVVDLGSRTGVRWEDGLRSAGWVDPVRGVQIGPNRIHFDSGAAGTSGLEERGGSLPISRSFRWGMPSEAWLEFPGAIPPRTPWRFSRSMILMGRSPICRVQLDGPKIGQAHASIVRTPVGDWVVDLLCPGGLSVEGRSTRAARLADGDRIEIGGHQVGYRLGATSTRTDLASRAPTSLHSSNGRRVADDASIQSRIDLSGVADPVTARLLDELNRTNLRTADQFREAMLLMFRMHQDQMDMIREGFSRLDLLENEQESLRAEMNRIKLPQPSRVTLRLVSGETPDSSRGRKGPVGSEDGRAETVASRPGSGPDKPGSESSDIPSAEEAGRGTLTGPDQHALLVQRLAEIKRERRGLWEKLFATLTGDGPNKGPR
ncbi:FHA domain-containing protein (plasmid) [Tundrisphaera lichenicola]|uniref:FHA domain-containing protein n=1 Tax=Tundrisphaera lichenicola TaxID=2029860 RepID=UPI003EBD2324